jgi:hypothetical protein
MSRVNIENHIFQRFKKKEKINKKKGKKIKKNMKKKHKRWTQNKKCLIMRKIEDMNVYTHANMRNDDIEWYGFCYDAIDDLYEDDSDGFYEDDRYDSHEDDGFYEDESGCQCLFRWRCRCPTPFYGLHSNPYFCDDNWRQREEDSWESLRDKD